MRTYRRTESKVPSLCPYYDQHVRSNTVKFLICPITNVESNLVTDRVLLDILIHKITNPYEILTIHS